MKTIVLNAFSSFATFPMFNPAYIKGLLCREGIDNIHIDVNQITWNSLLEEEFLAKLSFNEAVLDPSFPYTIISSNKEFELTKAKVLHRISKAKFLLRSSSSIIFRNLLWAQRVIFRALNLIYCHYGTFFMTNIPYWTKVGFDFNDISQIYDIATDKTSNPLICIFEEKVLPAIIKESPKIILVDIMFPWDIIPALTLNILLKKYLPYCHINYAGLGFDEFSFSRIQHKMNNHNFFFGFDSIFMYRNDNGLVQLVKNITNGQKVGEIDNLYSPNSFGHIKQDKLFDETVIPNYDDIEWSKYFFPERIVIDRLSYRCFWAKCNFCSINSNKRIKQMSSVKQQISKVKTLHEKYEVSNFWFLDEACPMKLALGFAEGIKHENIAWSLRTRLDDKLTFEALTKLKEAGLKELWIGLEHVNPQILSLMNKSDFNFEYKTIAKKVFDDATANNIGLHFCHILGFPSETDEQRQEVADFYKMTKDSICKKPFFTTFNIFGLMLGSPMFESREKFGIIEALDEESKFNMIKVPYKTIYNDDTGNIQVIQRLSEWIFRYTDILVCKKELIPLWMSISDTPFEFLLKKYYTYNPFSNYELD